MAQTRTGFNWAEGFYRLRNARLYQSAIPFGFRCVLNWRCKTKDSNQSYKNYIYSLRGGTVSNTELNKIYKKSEIDLLHDTNPKRFDTSFLFKCVTQICDPTTLSTAPAQGTPQIPIPGERVSDSPAAALTSWNTLKEILKECKNKRNAAAHEVTTTAVSESYFGEVKALLEELIDTAADHFGVLLDEKKIASDELNEMLDEIEHGMPTDKILWGIKEKFLISGKNEMKTRWTKFTTSKLLISSNVEANVESVYSPVMLNRWDEASTYKKNSITNNDFEAEIIFGKWPEKSNENIKLLSGDAGSGKTFFTQIIILSWLGLINVYFKKLEDFELLCYMQCQNDRHESLTELIKANYPNTCSGLDMDKVVDAFKLFGTRILYIVDGADERNERSSRLVEDILDQFSPDTSNTCLLTLRPHEVESIKLLLTNKKLSYQGCTVKELSEVKQVKYLERIQKVAPLPNIVKCFTSIKIKSAFHHPLNLRFFCELYVRNPEEVAEWTEEADVMHAMYNFYKQLALQKLKVNSCSVPNLDIIVKKAFEQLEQHAFKLFLNAKYRLIKKEYEELRIACYEEVSSEVDYTMMFSNVLWCENDAQGRETGVYHFPHRSTQEYLQAMAIITSWEKDWRKAAEEGRTVGEDALMAETFVKMIKKYEVIFGADATTLKFSDFSRYDKTIQFLILELLRTHRPRVEDNIKGLTKLLRLSSVTSFQYWAGLVSASRLHPVVVHESAVGIDDGWEVGPGQVEAADALLAYMKQCQMKIPVRVAVVIPSDMATPDTVPNLLRTVGGIGERTRLSLWFNHDLENFVPCDDLLDKLNNSPVMDVFIGCLRNPGRVLAPLIPQGRLNVPHIPSDIQLSLALTDLDHDLDIICHREIVVFEVYLRCPPSGTHSSFPRRPLPSALDISICLLNVPAGEREWPYRCLTALIPKHKRYDGVKLINCGLSNDDLDNLWQSTAQMLNVWNSTDRWRISRDWINGTRDVSL